tara:strand:+ start:612 stop:845 length:234 start_codon:yes stop_codon:yes gene_type:complete
MDATIKLPFIYHFEDYHEGSYYAKLLSETLGMDIHCEELDKDKYPTSAHYPSDVKVANTLSANNFFPFIFDVKQKSS